MLLGELEQGSLCLRCQVLPLFVNPLLELHSPVGQVSTLQKGPSVELAGSLVILAVQGSQKAVGIGLDCGPDTVFICFDDACCTFA